MLCRQAAVALSESRSCQSEGNIHPPPPEPQQVLLVGPFIPINPMKGCFTSSTHRSGQYQLQNTNLAIINIETLGVNLDRRILLTYLSQSHLISIFKHYVVMEPF